MHGLAEPKEAIITRAPVAGCLILMFLAACDNVSWGGADVTIVPPPPKAGGPPAPGLEPGVARLPSGPILYIVDVAASRLSPVAEVSGDSLLGLRPGGDVRAWGDAFISENLRQGSEFVLFRHGVRVGTFIAQSASVDEAACRPLPRATGVFELGESAADAAQYLALAKVQAPQVQRRTVGSLEPTRTMRVLAPIFADRLLRNRRSPLPSNWDRAMAQLQPFPLGGSTDLAFAATFLVGDTLGPGLDDAGQALFFIGVPARLGYDTAFVSFSNYAEDGGKAAPRVIDFLDWDRDDAPELLLRVSATTDSWYESVGRGRDGVWRRLLRDRCQRPAPPPDTAAADTGAVAAPAAGSGSAPH